MISLQIKRLIRRLKMITEVRKIEGDYEVKEHFCLQGIICGSVVVRKGGVFELLGIVGKDVIVENGGEARICGAVSGNVINNGGSIQIYGVISGVVYKNAGVTFIDSKAKANIK